jgi:hypothetical protein
LSLRRGLHLPAAASRRFRCNSWCGLFGVLPKGNFERSYDAGWKERPAETRDLPYLHI